MRIDLSPEMIEQAKGGKVRSDAPHRPQPIIIPKAHTDVAPMGGVDFQQLLHNIYDAALITDLEGGIVMANIRANQFFLAEPGQLAHYNVLGLICNADESLLPTILETLKENRFVLMQASCARMDGSFFPSEISVNRLSLGGKNHLSFFVRDVTLRKEAQERLQTGNTALQNSSSGIAITGLNGEIEYCNPAFLGYFGAPLEEGLAGRNLRELFCQPARTGSIIETTRRGGEWAGELEMRRLDGETFFAHISVAANLNTDGEQVGMVLSALDVTPQKQAQRQLEKYAAELNRRNLQMQEDLNVASELHQAFLPSDFTLFPKDAPEEQAALRFDHLYCPSGTIGGDFFDLKMVSPHQAGIFITDVMGHGIRSALVVATIRGLLEQLRPLAADPGALMTQLNATYTALFKQIGGDVTFSTAFYAVIDVRAGQLRYTNASHPSPFLLRQEGNGPERLCGDRSVTGTALGLFGDAKYATLERSLAPNDLLLLYTDGLPEVEGPGGELYEAERFEKLLRSQAGPGGQKLLAALLDDARQFSSSEIFEDDICLLAVQFLRFASVDDRAPHPFG